MKLVAGLRILFLLLAVAAPNAATAQTCDRLFHTDAEADIANHEFFFGDGTQFEHREFLLVQSLNRTKLNRNGGAAWELTKSTAANVGREVSKISGSDKISSLLYLAAGFDSSTPFQLFPNLRSVIAVTDSPFVRDENRSLHLELGESDPTLAPWSYRDAVARTNSIAGTILGRLLETFPNIRFLRISGYEEKQLSSRLHRKPMHGLIEFDQGPGTLKRTYVHIDSNIPTFAPLKPWWWMKVKELGFDSLLVKASQSLYSTIVMKGSEREFDRDSMFVEIFRQVEKNGAWLVDGDSIHEWPWLKPPGTTEWHFGSINAIDLNLPLGYSSNAVIYRIQKQPIL